MDAELNIRFVFLSHPQIQIFDYRTHHGSHWVKLGIINYLARIKVKMFIDEQC
jgi:hypothetical protein